MDMSHMDMSHMDHMDHMDGMSMMSGEMMMPTYFTASIPTVPLWFEGWTPRKAGTTFGACFGLFALTLFVKALNALRCQAAQRWNRVAGSGGDPTGTIRTGQEDLEKSLPARDSYFKLPVTPFNARRDISLGLISAFGQCLSYFLMLAVMTYNVYFFVSIILGGFVGEVIFGRWIVSHIGH